MFEQIRNGELVARFYGRDKAVLSRRNGARLVVGRSIAEFLFDLLNSQNAPLLDEIVRGEPQMEGSLKELAHTIALLIAKLDDSPSSDCGSILNSRGFAQYAIDNRIPMLALVDLTYACNLRCDHCYVLDKVSVRHPAELDRETGEKVVRALSALGCLDVTLSGGETTLHPHWRRLLSLAKDLHLHTIFKTNAITMSARLAKEYAQDPAHQTHVSLYGSTADVHDKMTKVAGSFERTLRGLDELRKVGVRCKVNVTVWYGNQDQLADIERLVQDSGHYVKFDGVIFGRLNGDRTPLQYRISQTKWQELVEKGYLKAFSPSACVAGMIKLKVSAEGGVNTCELLPESFGDVFKEDLTDIWRTKEVAGYGQHIVQISHSLPAKGMAPSRNCCPGLNGLNTGNMHGPTVIA